MSEQHWIDAFFRKRLGDRSFPVEAGEFEEMRALLDQRNATGGAGTVRSRFSKWWFSALIPVAGLVWWAFSGNEGDVEADVQRIVQEHVVRTNTGEQHAQATLDITVADDAVPSDPVVTGQEGSADDQTASAVALDGREPNTRASLDTRATNAARSGSHATAATTNDHRVDAHAHATSTTRSAPIMQEPDRGDASGLAKDGRSGSVQVKGGSMHEAGEVIPQRSEQSDASTVSLDVLATRSDVGVDYMEPLIPSSTMAVAPAPIQREVPVFERLPMGALHVFGAPLFVRTKYGSEAGSLFGLEYRMRAKRFVWATGVHYGSYALKTDGDVADVKLNFVEVPVLASYQVSRGRLGLAMQGGIGVDLLFNSRGRYRVEGDAVGSAFPDEAFRTANLSVLLRPQVNYHVNEHLSVNAGPLWKFQLGEVAKVGPLEEARINSTGIAIGITWRLDHATF